MVVEVLGWRRKVLEIRKALPDYWWGFALLPQGIWLLFRSQTAKGIWMARYVGIEPCTLVMDLEGIDGRERGESALFALAVSDIVLINMWCHDTGHEQAAKEPLLKKTVFQTPLENLEPVLREDIQKTPLENLEPVLREDIQKIWDSVPKPQAHKETPSSGFFNVEVVALSCFEENEEQFKEQVLVWFLELQLSLIFISFSMIWKIIKDNKDLDLPDKVMLATVCCEEIANEECGMACATRDCAISSSTRFGRKLSSILDTYLLEYGAEATYFDKGVNTGKRKQLEVKLLQRVQPAFQLMLGRIRSGTLERYKEAFNDAVNGGKGFAIAACDCTVTFVSQFDEACADAIFDQANWDSSKVRDKLRHVIDAHVATVRTAKLSELTSTFETKLNEALSVPVEALLNGATDDTWPGIRELLQRETETAVWTGKEDIQAITKTAPSSSQKLLYAMEAIRLDDEVDNVEKTLSLALLDSKGGASTNKSLTSLDPLASSIWYEVPPTKALITPVWCKSLWRQFKTETEYTVTQALGAQYDTAFEMHSAFFALVVSDTVLINMWCHDIGR
ncbi:hypothetical protein ACH5RR_006003 [Cinchona calisaya]|uniref:GB1/RHD3-type G domain-containing protein n=1 Tax=Cinchona calisaya TaxID=153742 RepID=A0ABD3AMY0_9GENT